MKMELFEKECLKNDYEWTGDEVHYSILLTDETQLTITNGNEILCFVNWFFITNGLISRSSLHRLEYLLLHMPKTVCRRKEVATWLRKNWDHQFHIKNSSMLVTPQKGMPGFTENYLMAKAS